MVSVSCPGKVSFLLRNKYYHRGFTMTMIGSFLHNPLWEKTSLEKPPSPTSSHCLEVSGGRRFSNHPFPELPVPAASSEPWKDNKIICICTVFLTGHQTGKAARLPSSPRPWGELPPARRTACSAAQPLSPLQGLSGHLLPSPPAAPSSCAEFGDEEGRRETPV